MMKMEQKQKAQSLTLWMFVRQQLNIGYTLCANGNWSAKIPWKNEIVNQTRRRSTAFVWNWIWWKHMSAPVITSCNMHTSQRFSREKWKKMKKPKNMKEAEELMRNWRISFFSCCGKIIWKTFFFFSFFRLLGVCLAPTRWSHYAFKPMWNGIYSRKRKKFKFFKLLFK